MAAKKKAASAATVNGNNEMAAVVSALVTRIAHQDFVSDQTLVDLNNVMLAAQGMDPVAVDGDDED